MQELGVTSEEISNALRAMARGDGFDGPEPAKEFVKAWAMFMLTVSGAANTTATGDTLVLGGTVSGGSNLVYQLSTKEIAEIELIDTVVATTVGVLTQGKGLTGSVGINMGGAYGFSYGLNTTSLRSTCLM